MEKADYKSKYYKYKPVKIYEGDWVIIMKTKEKGCVQRVFNGGERVAVIIPSASDWPFPRWVWIDTEKVRKSSAPKPEKEPEPDVQTITSLVGKSLL